MNQYFHSFFRSMWSLLVYIAGGFQTRHPITHGGEIVAVLSIVLGLGVVTWFIAELAGHFVKSALVFALLGRDRVPENTEHHIVIVNWDHRAESMIRELHGPDLPKKRPIVVISRDTFEFPSDPEFRNCSRVVGEPTDIQHLKRARVAHAESVTILSAWRNSDQSDRRQTLDANAADGKTILTILGIRTVCSEAVPVRQVPITAEIRSGSNVGSAQTAGRGGLTEIVCAERFGAEVLTQCAWTPGLAALYEDLLTFEPGTNEIYKIKAPKNCINKVFSEVLHQFAATLEDKAYAAIPIAIYRDGKVYLNPPDDDPESGVLREGDYLFVIADHAPVGL